MPLHEVSDAGEVVRIAAELIRIDTTNTGGPGTVGEAEAARYVAELLVEVGGQPVLLEPEPGRTSVLLRIPGTASTAADPCGSPPAPGSGQGVLVHGHLDVVPARPHEWTVDPFGGLVRDGYLCGRGAVDMKGTDAVMLTVARRWLRSGVRPRHDVTFAWLADEEAGGALGAQWLCRHRPELIAGCGTAIGEVGGFSIPIGRANLYPVMTAERAHAHLRLTARGSSGHGSISTAANPISILARAVLTLAEHPFAATDSAAVLGFLDTVGPLWGFRPADMPLERAVAALGPLSQLVAPALRHSVNPTMAAAGYSPNVVPGEATATLDCRVLPGRLEEFQAEIRDLLDPAVEVEFTVLTRGMQSPFDGPLIDRIRETLQRNDPLAVPVPYMVSASTDAAHFAELGMQTYGFSPLRLPRGFHFGAMFHGVDERVPVAGLEFGVTVLDDLLRNA